MRFVLQFEIQMCFSVKLRIKTDGKQLEMMEDPNGNETKMDEENKEILDNGLDEEMEIINNVRLVHGWMEG